ncbi:RepB plasmid partitioning protein, partial [Salmonella enterica]|nr:RepB plasmid partitioning protein [Salmonella enterica]EBQ3308446.1 RepB plasmid partitioning protein [Salmonella enterica]HAF3659237.1 RepB plasmid partitioning protein [Salmonella enterica]
MNKPNFGNKCFIINVSDLLYGKELPINVKSSVKYHQIVSTVKT